MAAFFWAAASDSSAAFRERDDMTFIFNNQGFRTDEEINLAR